MSSISRKTLDRDLILSQKKYQHYHSKRYGSSEIPFSCILEMGWCVDETPSDFVCEEEDGEEVPCSISKAHFGLMSLLSLEYYVPIRIYAIVRMLGYLGQGVERV